MKIEHFDSAWQLTVFPKTQKTENVAIGFKVLSLDASHFKTLLKFEVRAEVTGNEMTSPANRHMSRTRGPYAEPVHEKPAVWTVDYTPVQAQQEFLCENFIDHQHLPYYLGGGCLTLHVDAFIKTVEVIHNFDSKTKYSNEQK